MSALSEAILQLLENAFVTTIADAITVMQSIDDMLPNSDGLKGFNLLYQKVTQEVQNQPPKKDGRRRSG